MYILSYLASHALSLIFFFFNDTPTTEIYTLSLHDALPIYERRSSSPTRPGACTARRWSSTATMRSGEHTSELQSLRHLVCRLLLEKKKKKKKKTKKNKKQIKQEH